MSETLYADVQDIGQLYEPGFISIEHGLSNDEISGLFTQFEGVSHTIREEDTDNILLNSFYYKLDDTDTSTYYYKETIPGQINPTEPHRGRSKDKKRVLHFGPQTPERVRHEAGTFLPDHFETFLDDSLEAYHQLMRAHRIGARLTGTEATVHTVNDDAELDRAHMRYLMYDPSTDTPDAAGKHFDRSFSTLAAGENSPGLHGTPVLNRNRTPLTEAVCAQHTARMLQTPIMHRPEHGKYFLGAGYEQAQKLGIEVAFPELPILLHGVAKQIAGDNVAVEEWRKSLILFVHPTALTKGYKAPTGRDCNLHFDLAA